MPATLLQNGKQQFIDINGAPLVDGQVFFYVPNTLVPKDTWQDSDKNVLNTNPVILDSRGQAVIYGDGEYRQMLYDENNDLIWDELTESGIVQEQAIWTPTDDSGSGVGYSSASGMYIKTGKQVTVYGSITANPNASATPVLIGGLPFTVYTGTFPPGPVNTDAGINIIARAQSGTKTVVLLDNTNTPIAMSSISGKLVGFTITYFTTE